MAPCTYQSLIERERDGEVRERVGAGEVARRQRSMIKVWHRHDVIVDVERMREFGRQHLRQEQARKVGGLLYALGLSDHL